jgi:hypothetical protein
VWPAAGPVDAASREDPPRRAQGCRVDAELDEQLIPAVGELVIAVVDEADRPSGQEMVARFDAAASRQVVITGSCLGPPAGGAMLTRSERIATGGAIEAMASSTAATSGPASSW